MKTNSLCKKHNHLEIWASIIIIVLFVIFLDWPEKEEKQGQFNNPLIEILEFEIASATEYFKIINMSPNCLDYALYYNKSLQKYEGMDIRFPRRIDICNNNIYCENLHTYLLVNGYGMEVILDGDRYAGLIIINIKNKTK